MVVCVIDVSSNYRRSTLFVQRRAPCWPTYVRVTVAVNVVCANGQCTCETCIRVQYRTPTHLGRQCHSAVT